MCDDISGCLSEFRKKIYYILNFNQLYKTLNMVNLQTNESEKPKRKADAEHRIFYCIEWFEIVQKVQVILLSRI